MFDIKKTPSLKGMNTEHSVWWKWSSQRLETEFFCCEHAGTAGGRAGQSDPQQAAAVCLRQQRAFVCFRRALSRNKGSVFTLLQNNFTFCICVWECWLFLTCICVLVCVVLWALSLHLVVFSIHLASFLTILLFYFVIFYDKLLCHLSVLLLNVPS